MSDTALVLAAGVPAAITALATVYVARGQRGMRDKVDETHTAVTVNGHTADTRTVLDRLEELAEGQDQLRKTLADHLEWSASETGNMWKAIWHAFRSGKGHAESEEIPEQR